MGAVRTVEVDVWTDQPGHLLGTARMGRDPVRSVVDPDGRCHDVPNLYVADGSIFVTSGAVNPTSTITALALRLARGIADRSRDQVTAEHRFAGPGRPAARVRALRAEQLGGGS